MRSETILFSGGRPAPFVLQAWNREVARYRGGSKLPTIPEGMDDDSIAARQSGHAADHSAK